mgnify:CR=1 FL=1
MSGSSPKFLMLHDRRMSGSVSVAVQLVSNLRCCILNALRISLGADQHKETENAGTKGIRKRNRVYVRTELLFHFSVIQCVSECAAEPVKISLHCTGLVLRTELNG